MLSHGQQASNTIKQTLLETQQLSFEATFKVCGSEILSNTRVLIPLKAGGDAPFLILPREAGCSRSNLDSVRFLNVIFVLSCISLTIHGFTLAVGIVLQPLFFQSKGYVEPLRQDVDKLLNQFADDWSQSSQDSESPFSVFKSLWASTGWRHVHLAVIEPGLRPRWWDALTRAFSGALPMMFSLTGSDLDTNNAFPLPERLQPGTQPDLSQLAAFYALYTLYFTQPQIKDAPKLPLKLTLSTIEHLLTVPAATPRHPQDSQFLLSQLFQHDTVLLYILPDETKEDPALPANDVSFALAEEAHQEMGKIAMGVQTQLQELATVPSSQLHQPEGGRPWLTDYLKAQQDYLIARQSVLQQQQQHQHIQQEAQQEGLKQYLQRAQNRLARDHPNLIDPTRPYLGTFGTQAESLVQSFTQDLENAAASRQSEGSV